MKVILFFAAVLVSTSSWAEVKVGQWTQFKATLKHEDGTTDTIYTKTTVLDLDKAGKAFFDYVASDANGKVIDTDKYWQDVTDWIDADDAKNIVASCAKVNGTPEAITVPAGAFDSCKIIDGNSGTEAMWIAPVTFGIAKWNFRMDDNGKIITGTNELVAYGN